MARKVVYIHGFNSSELSYKATAFGEYMMDKQTPYFVPRLHYDPRVALAQLDSVIDSDTVLLGSSLGAITPPIFRNTLAVKQW